MTTAIELQFLNAGDLAAHLQDLIDNDSATINMVVPTVKSWYLIVYTTP